MSLDGDILVFNIDSGYSERLEKIQGQDNGQITVINLVKYVTKSLGL